MKAKMSEIVNLFSFKIVIIMTKVLIATDKPFAPVAVNGIREIVEAQGYELVLLEKYAWLLQYDLHPKVRKVKLCLQFFGVYLTRWILLFYINRVVHRN